MKTNYTNGYWHAKDGQIFDTANNGATIATIPYFDKKNEEHQANQKLIAAAPEMFEALQALVKKFDSAKQIADAGLVLELNYALTAIQKATNP